MEDLGAVQLNLVGHTVAARTNGIRAVSIMIEIIVVDTSERLDLVSTAFEFLSKSASLHFPNNLRDRAHLMCIINTTINHIRTNISPSTIIILILILILIIVRNTPQPPPRARINHITRRLTHAILLNMLRARQELEDINSVLIQMSSETLQSSFIHSS